MKIEDLRNLNCNTNMDQFNSNPNSPTNSNPNSPNILKYSIAMIINQMTLETQYPLDPLTLISGINTRKILLEMIKAAEENKIKSNNLTKNPFLLINPLEHSDQTIQKTVPKTKQVETYKNTQSTQEDKIASLFRLLNKKICSTKKKSTKEDLSCIYDTIHAKKPKTENDFLDYFEEIRIFISKKTFETASRLLFPQDKNQLLLTNKKVKK